MYKLSALQELAAGLERRSSPIILYGFIILLIRLTGAFDPSWELCRLRHVLKNGHCSHSNRHSSLVGVACLKSLTMNCKHLIKKSSVHA